ncbi:MAG: efflux RND transporter periplasmic adaptor subunit [Myxococcota bacterium]|nr:efflux RND transporter periplasmic adaptor subunit [Myxococcota bacterium]
MLLTFLFLFSCEESEYNQNKSSKKKKPKPLLVDYEHPFSATVAKHLELTGNLEGVRQATIIPPLSGTVRSIHVKEGDLVEKNTPLATIFNASIDAAEQRSLLELQRNEREFKKSQSLHEQGAIAQREYQETLSALDAARISHSEAQKNKAQATVKSPLRGTVATIDIREGEQAGGGAAFSIIDLTELRLSATIPERELSYIQLDQTAEVFSAYSAEMKTMGTLSFISPIVDSSSGSVKVFIDLEKDQNTLRFGQFVRARVEIDRHEDVLCISKDALIYKDGQPIVYTIEEIPLEEREEAEEEAEETDSASEEDGPQYRAKTVNIKIGYGDENNVEIVDGLTREDRVITLGNTALRESTPIAFEPKEE